MKVKSILKNHLNQKKNYKRQYKISIILLLLKNIEILVNHSLANLVNNVTNIKDVFLESEFNGDISNSFACKSC